MSVGVLLGVPWTGAQFRSNFVDYVGYGAFGNELLRFVRIISGVVLLLDFEP